MTQMMCMCHQDDQVRERVEVGDPEFLLSCLKSHFHGTTTNSESSRELSYSSQIVTQNRVAVQDFNGDRIRVDRPAMTPPELHRRKMSEQQVQVLQRRGELALDRPHLDPVRTLHAVEEQRGAFEDLTHQAIQVRLEAEATGADLDRQMTSGETM